RADFQSTLIDLLNRAVYRKQVGEALGVYPSIGRHKIGKANQERLHGPQVLGRAGQEERQGEQDNPQSLATARLKSNVHGLGQSVRRHWFNRSTMLRRFNTKLPAVFKPMFRSGPSGLCKP